MYEKIMCIMSNKAIHAWIQKVLSTLTTFFSFLVDEGREGPSTNVPL